MNKILFSLAIAVAVVAVSFAVVPAVAGAYSGTSKFPCTITAPDALGRDVTFMSGTCFQLGENDFQFVPRSTNIYYTFRNDHYKPINYLDIRSGTTIRFTMYQADVDKNYFTAPYVLVLEPSQGFKIDSSSNILGGKTIYLDFYANGLDKITVIGADVPYKFIGIETEGKSKYFG